MKLNIISIYNLKINLVNNNKIDLFKKVKYILVNSFKKNILSKIKI